MCKDVGEHACLGQFTISYQIELRYSLLHSQDSRCWAFHHDTMPIFYLLRRQETMQFGYDAPRKEPNLIASLISSYCNKKGAKPIAETLNCIILTRSNGTSINIVIQIICPMSSKCRYASKMCNHSTKYYRHCSQ